MKLFLFFVLLVFFTLPAFGQIEEWREVDFHVKGIGFGTSYSNVVKKLGKPLGSKSKRFTPDATCSNAAEIHLTLSYSGLEIMLIGDGRGRNFEVFSIEVTSKKWSASGVAIGADAKDVLSKFGEPMSKEEEFGKTIFYYATSNQPSGVSFHFRNNKLVKAGMTETLC